MASVDFLSIPLVAPVKTVYAFYVEAMNMTRIEGLDEVVGSCCDCGRDLYALRGQWFDEAVCSPCEDEAADDTELTATQELPAFGCADLLATEEEHFERTGGWLECPRTELYQTVEMTAFGVAL